MDALIAQGHTPSLILADRGYTYLKQQMWAMPLHQRGIAQVIDLHKQQRGIRPGPIPGTVYADGGLFTDALPQRLRALLAPTLQMTSEERALLATRYDERTPYAFTTLGKPDRERGTQRYRGPAVTGRVRCPNHLTSMRLSAATRPTTSCTPDKPCACGLTVTLGPDDSFGTRQGPLWGTTKWKASYGRRSAVESANACLKIHHGQLQRHSTRVMGTTRTAILLAFIIAATNTSLLISRYHYDIGDPPADEQQPVASEPNARTALHRKRAFGRRTRATAAVPETAETGSARDGPPPTDDFANII
ncbi:MAG: hypothetical protein L0H96_18315 [Humibacillus sp.]|nr:hypothetical protein [Humibacillus sp.]MDN5778853.1 hypothetical protein [Humibacillus sp.]